MISFVKHIISVQAACIILLAAGTCFSQTYSITPDDTMMATVPFNDNYHFIIQQNNLTDQKLVFHWQQINADIPEGWTAYLCDLGFCYGNFPENGVMDSVYPGEYGLLSVGINPIDIAGTANIRYTVWEGSTPDIVDTLTWIISAGSLSIDQDANNSIRLYPDPAAQNLTIQSTFAEGFTWKIWDVSGNVILEGISQSAVIDISVESFSSGIYFISIGNKDQRVITEQFYINN